MEANVRFFPIGNADTCLVDAGGCKFVFDFAAPTLQGGDDRRIDLAQALRAEFENEGRDSIDVASFSHLDSDHFAGASEFFHLEHAEKYQGPGRIRIKEMWVPAAAILESKWDQSPEGRVIQAEARHRLREGKGIRVISRPEVLNDWLRNQGIAPGARRNLIVGAGDLMPGFSLESTGIEFFVHAPFSDQRDESEVDRNGECTVFHATIKDGPGQVKLMLTGDSPYDVLGRIVETSEKAGNQDRLEWDIIKVPHHSSYRSLSPERGDSVTTPVPSVGRLYEKYGNTAGTIVSPSKTIPSSDEILPPHRQAAEYYKKAAQNIAGHYLVTMEHPAKESPRPVNLKVSGRGLGVALEKVAPTVTGAVITSPPRAGDHGY
ncbi:MAG: hypothetical protein OXC99_00080 [Chloroflexi bacterium]|nr:hypothetical protein [Chloroflexota bacterium]